MWFRWMMAAFFFNGLCAFGLRILAGLGLASSLTSTYLVLWYVSGGIFLTLIYIRHRGPVKGADVAVGGTLGFLSACGQTSIGLALAGGLPGAVVYPVTLAGGLFLVVAAGVILFRERLGTLGRIGILLGVISIALLSLD